MRESTHGSSLLFFRRGSTNEAWPSDPTKSASFDKIYSIRAVVNGWLCLTATGTGIVHLVHLKTSAIMTSDVLQGSSYSAREYDIIDIFANRLVYSEELGRVHGMLDLSAGTPRRVDAGAMVRQELRTGREYEPQLYKPDISRSECDCDGCTPERRARSSPSAPLWLHAVRDIGPVDEEDDHAPSEMAFLQLQGATSEIKSLWISPSYNLEAPVNWPQSHQFGDDLVISGQLWKRIAHSSIPVEWLADFRSEKLSFTELDYPWPSRLSTAVVDDSHATDEQLLFSYARADGHVWYRVRLEDVPLPAPEDQEIHSRLKQRDCWRGPAGCTVLSRPLPNYHLPQKSKAAVYIGGVKRLLAFLEADYQ